MERKQRRKLPMKLRAIYRCGDPSRSVAANRINSSPVGRITPGPPSHHFPRARRRRQGLQASSRILPANPQGGSPKVLSESDFQAGPATRGGFDGKVATDGPYSLPNHRRAPAGDFELRQGQAPRKIKAPTIIFNDQLPQPLFGS